MRFHRLQGSWGRRAIRSVLVTGLVVGTVAVVAPVSGASSASAKVDPNAVLKYGRYNDLARGLDPTFSNVGSDVEVLRLVYDTLIHTNSKTGVFEPGLASKWVISPDGLTIDLSIAAGNNFQDNTPINAAAVVANLTRYKSTAGSTRVGDMTNIASFAATDPMTVRLTMKQPDLAVLGALADRLGMMASPASFAAGANPSNKPIGSGPFKLTAYQPSVQMTFVKWDGYRGAKDIKLAGVNVLFLSQTAASNAVRSGQVDGSLIDPSQLSAVQGASGIQIQSHTSLATFAVTFNKTKAPVDNVKVRQALAYATDKQGILKSVLFGQGVVDSQIFPPGYYAYNPTVPADAYPYNPKKAKALLAEAGYPNGFSLDMTNVTDNVSFVALNQVLVQNWAAIGVKVNLRDTLVVNSNTLFMTQQCCQVTTGQWLGRPSPLTTLGAKYSPGGANNAGNWQAPQAFLDAYTAANKATTAAESQKAIRAAVKATVDGEFGITIAAPKAILAVSTKVKGLKLGFDGYANVLGAFFNAA
jgi:peptide/nickel transport system substrate-binding protein